MSSFRYVTATAVLCTLLAWTTASMAAPGDQNKRNAALRHGLGTATSSALYHTHLFISSAADGYKGKVLQAQQVRSALGSSAKITTALIDDLNRVKATDPTPEDVAQIDMLLALCDLVIEEARLLSGVIRTGTSEAEKAYVAHHLKVRARLAKLLGI